MVQTYNDIVNTALSATNYSDETKPVYSITKEKVTSNFEELEQLYLNVVEPLNNYSNKFLLTPEVIANPKYKAVVYTYFSKEYEGLDADDKLDGKTSLSQGDLKLVIAVGLGSVKRLKSYSKSSIMLILEAHYGSKSIALFAILSKFLNGEHITCENSKKEIEELKKQVASLTSSNSSLTTENNSLKSEKQTLTNQVNSLTTDKNNLTSENNTLKAEKSKLQKQFDDLKKEFDDYKAKHPAQ